MSKEAEEILSAEFWFKEVYGIKEDSIISFEVMNNYAKYVHQSRVNAISDDEIDNTFNDGTDTLLSNMNTKQRDNYFKIFGAKWFKNKNY